MEISTKATSKITRERELVLQFINQLGTLQDIYGSTYTGEWNEDMKSGGGNIANKLKVFKLSVMERSMMETGLIMR